MLKAARPTPKYNFSAYLYILPAAAIYVIFVFWPILQSVGYSFTDWDGLRAPNFIGLKNYLELLRDSKFHDALGNNLVFIFFYSFFPIVIGLWLAALLSRPGIKGLAMFRTGLFLPQVMSMIVVGMVWRWIYHPQYGAMNQFLQAVGLGSWARPWLGDFDWALPSIGVAATWAQFGFCLVLFLAGMQSISRELYDAAKIDGAGEFAQFWHVTLPGLRPQLMVAFISTLISAIRVFDLVYVTTRGGPGTATLVSGLYLYRNAFTIGRVGYGAAIAVVLTLLILIISWLVLRAQRKSDDNQ
jgi:raffinose/stachyose/melibiose transport system permease protein